MTVYDLRRTPTVPFDTIKIGEMFIKDGFFVMKTESCDGHTHNAVNLKTGELYYFMNDEECIKIHKAILNIHE